MSQMMPVSAASCELLIDSTAWDSASGQRVIQQQIFDHILSAIHDAQRFIYLDYFLWNPWQGSGAENHRALSGELADALIARKQAEPALSILVLTDPINRIYGGQEPAFFSRMREAGIAIVFTEVDALPDSNRIYSAPARFYGPSLGRLGWVRKWLETPRWTNPFSSAVGKVSPLQMAKLLFFKANHRKILITDGGNDHDMLMIVSSLNPADGSAAHCNLGIQLEGPLAAVALQNEMACVRWSAESSRNRFEKRAGMIRALTDYLDQQANLLMVGEPFEESTVHGQWLTDGAIKDRVVSLLNGVTKDDRVRIGMFYLSDREVVKAIKKAISAGAEISMILDANKDAFGRTKNGIPNRPVAAELMKHARQVSGSRLTIRWADTHGEQFHSKIMAMTNVKEDTYRLLCGSANWTRRNIGDLNLEANVYLEGADAVVSAFNDYFDSIFKNADGLQYTAEYMAYAETGVGAWFKKWIYRFQEASGACTF